MHEALMKCEDKMTKTLAKLDDDLGAIRAGRANPHVLDHIRVNYYGTPTPIQQTANVSVPEPRIIQIAPWDKSMVSEINKAIQASDLGINPTIDGNNIRLIFPELTEERRKEIVKDIAKMAEAKKVHIRNIRRDTIDDLKKLKKSGDITEDEQKKAEKKVQELTDKYIKSIDSLSEAKQKEVMSI